MKKDDEENKKKMLKFAKKLKDNAARRRSRTVNDNANESATHLTEQNTLPINSINLLNQPSNANGNPTTSKNMTAINAPEISTSAIPINATTSTATNSIPAIPINATTSTATNSIPAMPTNQIQTAATVKKPDNSSNNENNCSICLRENNDPALCNECFHCFCFSCIQQWSEQSNQCPVCRREYNLIYYNIRSENEYDELPVQSRRRQNEFEIILPLGSLVELDRTIERLINVPPMIFPSAPVSPFPGIFLPPPPQLLTNPIERAIADDFLRQQLAQPRLENLENTVTFTITNLTQPDENGRVIQRTLYFSDPSVINSAMSSLDNNQANFRSSNIQTPVSSLEQNRNLHLLNPLTTPEFTAQPTIIFNPDYDEPYRNIFQPASTTNTNNPFFDTHTSGIFQDQSRIVENLFERIFSDLNTTSISPTTSPVNQTNHRQRNRNLPISEINNLRRSNDQDSDDENIMLRSGLSLIRRPNQRISDTRIRRRRRSNDSRTNRQTRGNARSARSSRSANNRNSNRGSNSRRSGSGGGAKGSSSGKSGKK